MTPVFMCILGLPAEEDFISFHNAAKLGSFLG